MMFATSILCHVLVGYRNCLAIDLAGLSQVVNLFKLLFRFRILVFLFSYNKTKGFVFAVYFLGAYSTA